MFGWCCVSPIQVDILTNYHINVFGVILIHDPVFENADKDQTTSELIEELTNAI